MSNKKKRKRGGQSGNCNARKHGLYTTSLTPEETVKLAALLRGEEDLLSVALIRIRLEKALQRNPSNSRAVREAAAGVTRIVREKYDLDARDAGIIRDAVRSHFAGLALQAQQASVTAPENPSFPLSASGERARE